MSTLDAHILKAVFTPREVLIVCGVHLAILALWWNKQYWTARLQFPGPPVKNVWIGNLDQTMMPDIHEKWRSWHRQYGPIYQTWNSLLSRVIYIGDPAMIHAIATENWDKASSQYEGFRPLSGDALFMPKAHNKWLRQRKSLSPAFGPQVIRMQYTTLSKYINEFTHQIATAADQQRSIDLSMLHVLLTLDFVGEIAFGSELRALATGPDCRILRLFKTILPELMKCGLFPLRSKIPILRSTRDMHRAIQELRQMAEDAVLAAREADMAKGTREKPPRRIFEILVRQKDPNGNYTFNTKDLVDNYVTFLVAGGDPTAHTLSFAVYEVLRNPTVHARLVHELREALPNLNDMPSAEHVSKLPYLNAIIKETLRWNGPGFGTFRTCARDTQVCGITLPAYTTLVLWNPQVHRDPKLWGSNANVFDPSRWLKPDFRPPPGSYFPFSYGPRVCLGQGLAMFEISLTLATLFRQFDLSLPDGFEMEFDPAFTLCPKNGLPVFATRRTS